MNEKERLARIKEFQRVVEIFKPWGGWGTEIPLVADMIKLALVTYTVERIPLQRPPDFKNIATCPGSETDNHLILKHTAHLLLKELGENNPLFEHNLWDVYSPKSKIRIECGHTEPGRMCSAFCYDDLKEFWILQYPEKGEELSLLYKFKPSPNCKAVLNTFFEERMKKMAERMQ